MCSPVPLKMTIFWGYGNKNDWIIITAYSPFNSGPSKAEGRCWSQTRRGPRTRAADNRLWPKDAKSAEGPQVGRRPHGII